MPDFTPLVVPPPEATGPPRWYVVRDGEVLTTPEGTLPAADPAGLGLDAEAAPVFLGVLGDVPCWAVGVAATTEPPGDTWFQPLRALSGSWSTDEFTLAGRAVQLVEWARTSRFCGRCGSPTERAEGERSMRCPSCGLTAYPRLAPAIIVLVRRGEQALLAQGARWRGRPMFSTLAGFVEAGETFEEAVHREVREEVGIEIRDPRYVASQPWPFPHSVMVGFTAEWAGGELAPDGEEIIDAAWFDADDLPNVPPPASIARRLIDGWVAEVGGRRR
ncbi:MAG TPA: NAD(+) diphosphatase [Acidimicrobiales bacterium]|nr:NAD(+) diphosphatase [Acidimicrobiales bacterium]